MQPLGLFRRERVLGQGRVRRAQPLRVRGRLGRPRLQRRGLHSLVQLPRPVERGHLPRQLHARRHLHLLARLDWSALLNALVRAQLLRTWRLPQWRVLVPCRLERRRLLGGGGLPSQLLGPWRVRWRSAYMHVRRGVLGWCVRGSPLPRLRGARPVPRSRRVQLRRGLRRPHVPRATLPAQLLRCERPWHMCGPQPVQMRCGLVGRRLLRSHLRRALWRSRQVHRRQPMRVRCGLEGCAL